MKDYKRALRRWNETCKFEKRIKTWVPANRTQCFYEPGKGINILPFEEVRDKIRKGELWSFLKDTSTPCSCSMCSYPKYVRTPKQGIDKEIWEGILDSQD